MTVDICQEVIRGVVTIAAAGFAAWLGLKVFLRQKEFELVKQRYLEGAIDVIAQQHEEVLGIVCHNWARCLHLLLAFRDESDSFDIEELQRGFLALDSSKFHTIAHHRLQVLVGSEIFWEVYQLALSFAVNANVKVTKEIPAAIRIKLSTEKIVAEIEKIVEESIALVQRIDNESQKFSFLTKELELLAGTLQVEQLTFKNVSTFRERPDVKASVSRLKEQFSKEIGALPCVSA